MPQTRDEVHAGEMLIGFQNQRGDPPFPEHNGDLTVLGRESIADSGSFLVIRKLRQYVEAFNRSTDRVGVDPSKLRAKMVGRLDNGFPLLAGGVALPPLDKLNAFEFTRDADGSACPFHSHIRRGNPRLNDDAGAPLRIPRIARRGLSYGPRFDDAPSNHHRSRHDVHGLQREHRRAVRNHPALDEQRQHTGPRWRRRRVQWST